MLDKKKAAVTSLIVIIWLDYSQIEPSRQNFTEGFIAVIEMEKEKKIKRCGDRMSFSALST